MNNITSEEFKSIIEEKKACILPVGSYEQHGPHDILETDYEIADYLAKGIGEIVGIPVLPTVPYGISYVHKSFPGTIYICEENYINYISDILDSLHRNTVKNVFIINAHGGNYNSLRQACDKMEYKDLNCKIFNWFEYIGDDIFASDHRSHAGSMETSVLLAIDKNYVRESKVENMVVNESYKHTVISDMLECTFNGVILSADQYSYEKGVECINFAKDRISKEIEELLCAGK